MLAGEGSSVRLDIGSVLSVLVRIQDGDGTANFPGAVVVTHAHSSVCFTARGY